MSRRTDGPRPRRAEEWCPRKGRGAGTAGTGRRKRRGTPDVTGGGRGPLQGSGEHTGEQGGNAVPAPAEGDSAAPGRAPAAEA
ncbi:hypothetical protein GCM10010324_47490 [Streptomyces hiroshimensis]|uniref:Uncharacterized protein n=1 Tax=Streptomyces hiroshimensis TaxID=66424 RepID=A0ABQ2YY84_9ACTN|nr:hypothetical protein GCM10010324_47490 [Streptomyces hiroshimensis]